MDENNQNVVEKDGSLRYNKLLKFYNGDIEKAKVLFDKIDVVRREKSPDMHYTTFLLEVIEKGLKTFE